MKGHTVPWAFLPKELQTALAILLLVVVVTYTYRNQDAVRRWWPWLFAVVAVLLSPQFTGWLGFELLGIRAKSMAAELQSLATGIPWLKPLISALQSISTKGMGLKTAAVISALGGAFGRLMAAFVPVELIRLGILPGPAVNPARIPPPEEANPQPGQAGEQRNPLAEPLARPPPGPPHDHDD